MMLAVGLGIAAALCGCGGQTGTAQAGSEPSDPAAAEQPAASEEDAATLEFYAMDTYMTVTAYGKQAQEAAEQAEAEAHRLDKLLSTGDPDSEISRLNETGRGTLSKDAADLVEMGLSFYDTTDGKFDIAIYPIMKAWGFADQRYRVPSEEELEQLLPLVDAKKILFDEKSLEISFDQEGMAIDLGGIAKGYTSARMISVLKEHGITSGLVNLGGNVQALGSKPDGSDWRIAVQDPKGDGYYLGVLEASDTAVISSGAYERNFTQGGTVYHHIIDPADGRPADHGLQSVTIVSDHAAMADALSTSLYIMGKDKAIEFWRKHAEDFDCILLDDAGELFVTEPLEDRFSSEDYAVQIIR